MYVSSFSTYINTESSTKTQKSAPSNTEKIKETFNSKLLFKTVKNVDTSPKFPINYISNYKALNNQQKLQENHQNIAKDNFLKLEMQSSAKSAYSDNSVIFSKIVPPRATLNQTPKIDKTLPKNIQNIKENNLRHIMINTYISNENYYKTTA